MAILECKADVKEGDPCIIERIEVLPWRLGGKSHQDFVIGSGANFDATGNILIEIIYSVNDVQLFYTRNFIHYIEHQFSIAQLKEWLDKFKSGERDAFGFGDMLPETAIFLKREKGTYDEGDEQKTYVSYRLEVSADIGAGICKSGPGQRMIKIQVDIEEPEAGFEFMRQLVDEVAEVHQHKHPDPAHFPAGSSDWNFARQVNQKAYDRIALDYDEAYFSEPLLTQMFDAWLNDIPTGGHILDLGCGHGKPVIARLLEKGYGVTGVDLSPKMLERAHQNFPDVPFIKGLASELTLESEFDGACSLSSMLYLDPIDLSHSLYRLYHALKPSGRLLLYAYDLHPNWRGAPYNINMNEWMWSWTYGMDEAVQVLEEYGYFKVLQAKDVTTEVEKRERIEKWYQGAKEEHDSLVSRFPNVEIPGPDLNKPPSLSYKYIIIAQRQTK